MVKFCIRVKEVNACTPAAVTEGLLTPTEVKQGKHAIVSLIIHIGASLQVQFCNTVTAVPTVILTVRLRPLERSRVQTPPRPGFYKLRPANKTDNNVYQSHTLTPMLGIRTAQVPNASPTLTQVAAT